MFRRGASLVACLAACSALAQGEPDLDRIPDEAPAPAPAPSGVSDLKRVGYVESTTEPSLLREQLPVAFPSPAPPTIEERLFADERLEYSPIHGLKLVLNGRAELRAADNVPFPTHENIRVDVRELYSSWHPMEGLYLDLGRVNVRSGVAIGYNPTDFFKTRAVVEPLSVDPAVLREDRLGAVLARAQYVWSKGAVSAVFAPKIESASALYTTATLPSVDPMLDRTNAHNRLLVKGNLDVVEGFSPELLLYVEDGTVRAGANVAQTVGKSVVAYAEWSAGQRQSLLAEALAYGLQTGTLPAALSYVLPTGGSASLQQSASAGLSYANASKMTFWLEYHLFQPGFSRGDWQTWFDQGTALPGPLWYVRAYALDQQEPASKHSLFLRADWQDAFVLNLELSAFANVDLYDGSTLAQVTASYAISDHWSCAIIGAVNAGGRRTDFGSLPQVASALLTVRRYY
jgi:hypothetical protein